MFNYRNNSTQGGFMGNAGGLVGGLINNPNQMVGGLTNMAFQQPFQGLVGMGMDAMGYGPAGPAGGGLPPTPMASMYNGPQFGQVDQYPASAAGFLNKRVFS